MIRKMLTLCLGSAICVIGAGAISAQDMNCGTVVPQAQIELEQQRLASGIDYSQMHLKPLATSVPLTIHIVRSSVGTGGLTTPELNGAMDDLNAMYVPMDIDYYICGSVDYIDDDYFYLDMGAAGRIDELRQTNSVYGTINIYFVPSESGFPYCGISAFTGSAVQGIAMNNACLGATNPSTFAHEIGHYFDLFHTHETAFGEECPDGSNCTTAGDLLCDTPADPNISGHVSGYPECAYDNYATTPDGCTGIYDPQTENLMAYSVKACRDFWSAEQIAKAIYTLNNLRTELLPGCEPVLRYVGRSIAEAGGDGDGLVEPGEDVEIDVTIGNIGTEATGASGLLSTTDPYLTVTTASAAFDAALPAGSQSTTLTPFDLSVAPGCPDPHIGLLDVDVTADGGHAVSEQILLFVGNTPGFADDLESGEGFWTHQALTAGMGDEWHIDTYRSHSASSSWKMGGVGAANYADGSDAALLTPPFLLPANASLTFWHWIDAEDDVDMTAWDGGIVMISESDGTLTQIHPEGGYPYTVIDNAASPFDPGIGCYSGTFGWAQETFDLSAHSGVVQIMFRFGSDGYVNQEGWYVDDILIEGGCCGQYTGGITGNANCSDDGKVTLSDITQLINRVFIDKLPLCCEASGNTNADGECKVTLSDITVAIDMVFISKLPASDCMPVCEL